jgi:hypothetical protein
MFRVDDDESARELRALRQRAYLAELDAQVALKRERERRRDEAHAHRLFETQYARALENGADVASRAGRRAVNGRSSSSTLISPSSSARDVRGVRESAGRAPFRFLDADADAAGRRAERREKAERAAVLREELTRQMEENELAREMRRLALMREEEEEERRLRAERAALTRRFERADAKPAKDSVSARVESVGEMLSTTSASGFVGGEEEEEEEEACEFFEETTFVELPEPKTTNVETMVDEAPASPVTPAVMSRSVSRSEGVEEEFTTPPAKTTTGDDVLLRQGSVKAMAKLWDTPAKQRRNMERAERSTFNDDAVEDY